MCAVALRLLYLRNSHRVLGHRGEAGLKEPPGFISSWPRGVGRMKLNKKPINPGRHEYHCTICSHAQRDEVERAFLNWTSTSRMRVSFQIKDGSTTLTKGSPEFPASDVAEWSDEKLSQMIEVVTGGLVRKSA